MKTLPRTIPLLLPLIILPISGCGGPPDRRIQRMAKENADRQAEQNRQMAQQSQQITRTTGEIIQAETQARQDAMRLQRELVEADDRARQKILDMHQKVTEQDAQVRQKLIEEQRQLQARFQAERQNLDRQREGLETERRQIAIERIRDPVVAEALRDVGLAALCILPLVLCGYLLYVLNRGTADGRRCRGVGRRLVYRLGAAVCRGGDVHSPARRILTGGACPCSSLNQTVSCDKRNWCRGTA